jgi:hypothetical protein
MGNRTRRWTTTENLRRVRLFLVSYAPLWIMVALRALPSHLTLRWSGHVAWGSVGFAALGIYGFVDGRRLVSGAQRIGSRHAWFTSVSDQGAAVGGYLATYLLPFLGLTPAKLGDWLAYVAYATVAMILFVRTDLGLVNPTLYLYGWRVVSAVEADPDNDGNLVPRPDSSPVVVICRDLTDLGGRVDVVSLAGCLVTKKENRSRGGK